MPKATPALRRLREDKGLRVSELAARVGAKSQHMRNVESGHASLGRALAAKIAAVLEVEPSDFLEGGVEAASASEAQPEAPVDRKAYTVPQAAALLGGVSDTVVRDAITRGELAARKLGKQLLIPATEIDRWLSEAFPKSA